MKRHTGGILVQELTVKIYPAITVETENIIPTIPERNNHGDQKEEFVGAIKEEIITKNIIGILEVKRYVRSEERTTAWAMLVLVPESIYTDGKLMKKIASFLMKKDYGSGISNVTDLNVIGILKHGVTVDELQKVLEEFISKNS